MLRTGSTVVEHLTHPYIKALLISGLKPESKRAFFSYAGLDMRCCRLDLACQEPKKLTQPTTKIKRNFSFFPTPHSPVPGSGLWYLNFCFDSSLTRKAVSIFNFVDYVVVIFISVPV